MKGKDGETIATSALHLENISLTSMFCDSRLVNLGVGGVMVLGGTPVLYATSKDACK